jgi:hypothetical protein
MADDNSKDITSTTEQAEVKKLAEELGTNNPLGKGGFADNPQNINAGGRPKNAESFAYWYRIFKDMSVSELKEWQVKTPEANRSVASDLSFTRILNAKKDLREFQEVADRSEGKAQQTIRGDFTGKLDVDIPEEVVDVFNEAIKQGLKRKPADRGGNEKESADLDGTEMPNS